MVLGALLYGVETLTLKRVHSHKLEVFHNRCLRAILGITRARQRAERITTVRVRRMIGMPESLENLITAHRLRWLGHLAHMEDDRLPKQILLGSLPQKRPAHGTKMRWRDRMRKDLRQFKIEESKWYHTAQDQRAKCKEGLDLSTKARSQLETTSGSTASSTTATSNESNTSSKDFSCQTCHRSFR